MFAIVFVLGPKTSIFSLIFAGICCLVLARLFPSSSSLFAQLGLSALSIGICLVPVNILRGLGVSYGLYIYHILVLNILLVQGGVCAIFRKFLYNYLFLLYTFDRSPVLVSS